MPKISKLEKVTVKYKDNKIIVDGPTIDAKLSITSDSLKEMYWGGTGFGTLNLEINEPEEKQSN